MSKVIEKIALIIHTINFENDFGVFAYDLAENPYPLKQEYVAPHILFNCGENKEPYLRYRAKITADELLKFISDKSNMKLRYHKDLVNKSGDELHDFYYNHLISKRKVDL